MKKEKMLYDVGEVPPLGKLVLLALQHVIAMFGATILVPLVINEFCGAEVLSVPVALVTSGLGTLVYIFCTKGKSPVYLGSSFSFVTPMVLGYALGGVGGIFTGLFTVGVIYVIVSLLVRFLGDGWIDRLLPPVVVGPMIMIIGLSLAGNAVSQIGIAEGTVFDWRIILVACVSFFSMVLAALFAKGFFKMVPILVGIVSGYIVSLFLGMIDFSSVIASSFFEIPNFLIPFRDYQPNLNAVLTIAPIALVSLAEHVGDHIALGAIINKNLLKDPGLQRTILGDGCATFVSCLFGGPANTTYGENTSVVGMSKVASVAVIKLAACIAIMFGFLGKLTAVFETIPSAVFGGVSVLLYGFIVSNGLKVLIRHKVNFDEIRNVVIASSMLVLGLGGAVLSISVNDLHMSITGMSLAAVIGILLNLLLPKGVKKNA